MTVYPCKNLQNIKFVSSLFVDSSLIIYLVSQIGVKKQNVSCPLDSTSNSVKYLYPYSTFSVQYQKINVNLFKKL